MERAEDIFNKIKADGLKAIDEFIVTRKSEELFLDFKRSSDNGSGKSLSQNDRDNLAKAISGFGNSEGGVIVWGVDCSSDNNNADVAKAKVLITDVKRFVSLIENAISGCTVPSHSGVRNHYISIDDKDNGYVITYIPKSENTPHQVIRKNQYYMRAGSNFEPVPHSVLAGMFGRRPQAKIIHQFFSKPVLINENGSIEFEFGFSLRNLGPGIAKNIFINMSAYSFPIGNSSLEFIPGSSEQWNGSFALGIQFSLISKFEVRLPPEAFISPLSIKVILVPPFQRNININAICGCSDSPSTKFYLKNTKENIEKLYDNLLNDFRSSAPTFNERRDSFVTDLFGLNEEKN